MIQIVFQFTQKELFEGMMAVAQSRFGTKVSRVIGVVLILGSIVMIGGELVYTQGTSWYGWFFFVFSLFITFYLNILIWFQAKKLVERNAPITESMTYTFNQTDYTLRGESFSTRMDYAKLNEVRDGKDFILLKVSDVSAHIIPKRALTTGQFDQLKEIVQSIPEVKSRFDS